MRTRDEVIVQLSKQIEENESLLGTGPRQSLYRAVLVRELREMRDYRHELLVAKYGFAHNIPRAGS